MESDDRIDVLRLLGVLSRQWRLVLMTFLMMLGLSLLLLLNATPRYRATSLLYMEPSTKDLMNADTPYISAQSEHARVESEVLILRSEPVLLSVVEQAGLADDPEFGLHQSILMRLARQAFQRDFRRTPAQQVERAISRLRDLQTVRRQGNTYLAQISVSSADPVKAARIANLLAESYIGGQIDMKSASMRVARDALQGQIATARERVVASEGRAEAFRTTLQPAQDVRLERVPRGRTVVSAAPTALDQSRLFELEQEARVAQDQYVALLSRMRHLETQAGAQIADSRVVSQARRPLYPASPDRELFVVLALLFAGLSGAGAAFTKEYLVGGVVSTDQLTNIIPAPVLGTISHAQITDSARVLPDLIPAAPLAPYAEDFRRLRAGLDQAGSAHRQGALVVMVTSPNEGDGKSVSALALARTYAEAGKEVLLIDADLRKPHLHQMIGYQPELGFLEYLQAPDDTKTSERRFYIADPRSKCGIMLGRGQANAPTDKLLQSNAFTELLTSARRAVDVVIVDSSAILSAVDARYIAPQMDAVLMVVKYAQSSQAEIREAYGQLTAAGDRVYTVLNDAPAAG